MATEQKKDFAKEWAERCAERYRESVARGEHDEQCEYDPTGFYLCHCAKRRRVASGFTEPPSESLEFPPPDCPRCDKGLYFEEGWSCPSCSVAWDSDGRADSAHFTDDYGEDLAATKEDWRVANAAYLATKGAAK